MSNGVAPKPKFAMENFIFEATTKIHTLFNELMVEAKEGGVPEGKARKLVRKVFFLFK